MINQNGKQKTMHQFDRDIEVTRRSPLVFQSAVSPNWSVNGNPDGGYLMALLANAAQQCGEKKWPLIVTANFAARCLPGPAEVALELIGGSRSFDRWQATLSQEGAVKIRAICTMSDEQDDSGEKRYEAAAPDLPDPEQCPAMPNFPGYTMFEHLEVKLDPSCVGWMTGAGMSEISEQRGWLSFRDGRPFDALAVLLAADAFPPAVLASQGAVAWVPTIELSVNIRNIPRTPRLKCVFRSRFLNRGVVEEDGLIWDEDNELIAVSRQIARFRKNA
jgi:hypothetical protein